MIAIAGPPEGPPRSSEASEPERFELSPDDPRAADYDPREPRLELDDFAIPLRVSNHIVRIFGLDRPHAYGLDVQLGMTLYFAGKSDVLMGVRPQTGYAFVHAAEFNSHASITGVGLCLLPDELFSFCYTPSFVGGVEAGERSLGFRHGLGIGVAVMYELVSFEAQHGVVWVGAAGPRHELRGTLTLDVLELWILIYGGILAAGM